MKDQAFFAKYPVRIDDLLRPHALTGQKPYTVVAFVTLERIDYENFITDFTVERWSLRRPFRSAVHRMTIPWRVFLSVSTGIEAACW